MKILQTCNKPPFPTVDGGSIAMNNITHLLLKNNFNVKVFSLETYKHKVSENISDIYLEQVKFESCFIDTKPSFLGVIANLFTKKSYNISRFYDKKAEQKLTSIVKNENFDIIIFDSLFSTPYLTSIKNNCKSKLIYRAHNIEHKIWELKSKNENSLLKKYYFSFLAKRLKLYEKQIINCFDAIFSISNYDTKDFLELGCNKPIYNLPTGIEIKENISPENNNNYSLCYIGAFDWEPNKEGVLWFLNNCWDNLINKYPDLKFYIAGRQSNEIFKNIKLKNNVIIVGEVENADEFLISNGIFIVPLLTGSGIRIKIIEGLALGKTIITTSVGAMGINYTNNIDILIADNTTDFENAIIKCIENKDFCLSVGEKAKELACNQFDNNLLNKQIANYLNEIINE